MKKSSRSNGKAKKSSRTRRASPRMEKGDIIQLILQDHKALKRLVRVLKNDSHSLSERQEAFKEFAPLLISHAKPEEETLYMALKDMEKLRSEGFEGDVEHGLADQMVEEAKRTSDPDMWTAKVKVLAELVEHHLKEEEEDMLPDFKKFCDSDERVELGARYRELRARLLEQGGMDAIPEALLRKRAPEQQLRH